MNNQKIDKYIKVRLLIYAMEYGIVVFLYNTVPLLLIIYLVLSYYFDYSLIGFILGYRRCYVENSKNFKKYIFRFLEIIKFLILLFRPRFPNKDIIWKCRYGQMPFDVKYQVYIIKKTCMEEMITGKPIINYKNNVEYPIIFIFYIFILVVLKSFITYILKLLV